CYWQHPKTGASDRRRFDKDLSLESGSRSQSSLVEHLRRKRADAWSQPPRLRQEDAAVGGNGLVPLQYVFQRREVSTLGMRSLLRLLELLRVPKQYNTPGALRRGQHIG